MSNPMVERRYGVFCIDQDVLRHTPQLAQAVFGQCVILRAEMRLAEDQVKYTAACARFDPVDKGSVLPWYHWEMGPDGLVCKRGKNWNGLISHQ